MLNKTLTIIFFSLILLSVNAITVERSSGSVLPGEVIEIVLNVELDGTEPSSLIVTETIPENWSLESSTPNANDFDGKIKWLLYGNKIKETITLKYELKAPSEFEEQKLTGNWQTLEENGVIQGDSTITKAIEPKPTAEPTVAPTETLVAEEQGIDPMLIAVAVIIILLIIIVIVVLKKKK